MKSLIVIGPGRTGTTSIFNALNSLEGVNGTQVKELFYFSRGIIKYGEAKTLRNNNYISYFDYEPLITLEATPAYFLGADAVARRIKDELDEVTAICVLRDPIERFFSLYQHVKNKVLFDANLSLQDYIERCQRTTMKTVANEEDALHFSAIIESNYLNIAEKWLSVLGKDSLIFLDYEQLSEEKYVQSFAEKVLPNTGLKESISLGHTNSSKKYRSMLIQRLAQKTNSAMESYFNKHPNLKLFFKKIYQSINSIDTVKASDSEVKIIEDALNFDYKNFYNLMKEQGYDAPLWLTRKVNRRSHSSLSGNDRAL